MRLPILVLIVACGGSSSRPRDPAREAADARRKQLKAEEPKRPTELRNRIAFRPPERCGQGPYRIEVPAVGAKFAEELRVYACGIHDIAGNYRYSVHSAGKAPRTVTESSFGFGDRENSACKAERGAATMVAAGDDPGGGGAAAGARGATGATASVDAATVTAGPAGSLKTVTLEPVTSIPSGCSARIEILNMTHTSEGDYAPVEGRLVLDIWSEVPNDYEGMIFVVEQHGVVADMTKDRWLAHLEAEREWRVRWNAFLDGEVAGGRMTVVDSKVTAPPPPPPRDEAKPPRPSQNARWIPGYWLYEEAKFHWIAGLWDVPPSDIEQELTVVAPKPPPPAPPPTVAVEPAAVATATVTVVEKPPEPPPTVTAVWTPGYWQWDGRVYIWIAGAWRIPPAQESTWAPATWRVTKRGSVFVPGRWSTGGRANGSTGGRVRDHRRR